MICNLLSELKIEYCIDSGTLLGLVREGKLLAHDLDIDISVREDQLNRLKKLKEILKGKGYKCRVLNFFGKKYKFKFWRTGEKRVIDINIFRETPDNKFFICPQPFPIEKEENFLFRNFRKGVRVCFGLMKNIGSEFDLNNFPWSMGTYHRTWAIPKEYFDSFEHLENSIYMPNKSTEYLEFRYGNWRVPNSNWNFRTDDKGLSEKSPEAFNCF